MRQCQGMLELLISGIFWESTGLEFLLTAFSGVIAFFSANYFPLVLLNINLITLLDLCTVLLRYCEYLSTGFWWIVLSVWLNREGSTSGSYLKIKLLS